jgi:hypothetical protein
VLCVAPLGTTSSDANQVTNSATAVDVPTIEEAQSESQ